MDIHAAMLQAVGEHLRDTGGLPIHRVLSVEEETRSEQLHGQWASFIAVKVNYISRENGPVKIHAQKGSLADMLLNIRFHQLRREAPAVEGEFPRWT